MFSGSSGKSCPTLTDCKMSDKNMPEVFNLMIFSWFSIRSSRRTNLHQILWRIFAPLRSESAKKAYNLIRTAEHFTRFSAVFVTSHVSVKPIDSEEEPADDDLWAESPQRYLLSYSAI